MHSGREGGGCRLGVAIMLDPKLIMNNEHVHGKF